MKFNSVIKNKQAKELLINIHFKNTPNILVILAKDEKANRKNIEDQIENHLIDVGYIKTY